MTSTSSDTMRRTTDAVQPDPLNRPVMPEWVDRFLGSDPGLTRLRMALQAVVTIGAAMAAEWLFVHLSHALQSDIPATAPAAQAAGLAALNHGMLVIAIMLGAVVGMLASFAGSMFTAPRAQLVTFLLMPVPMVAGLSLGLALGPHRVAALAVLAVVLTVGTYCRRFGPRGFLGGMVLFMGYFFGFFLHGEIALSDVGWLTAEIAIGVLVAVVAQFTIFYPGRRAALRRMLRSYTARSRDVARRALDVFDESDNRARAARRLHRRLIRLNETALMIDAQLADPSAVPDGWSPVLLHQCIFDAELALTNAARFTERLAELPLTSPTRSLVRQALAAVATQDLARADQAAQQMRARLHLRPDSDDANADEVSVDHVVTASRASAAATDGGRSDGVDQVDRAGLIVLHRFATSIAGVVTAEHALGRATPTDTRAHHRVGEAADATAPAGLETSVMLFGGWLPGSTIVSAAASLQAEPGQGFWDRIKLAPYSRTAIQMGVAVSAAIVFGDMLSGRRFYWAVIAAFVTFMGANNAGEQLRKGFFRVAGTVVGVLLGAIGAHLVGQRTDLAIAVILASLFFGLYLMRISYAFMVIGVTIMVSQLYVQLDEFSNSLLVLRLEETALGAAVAAATVLCILPLRTGRVARVAAREYIQAVAELADQAVHRLTDPGESPTQLRAAARQLDAAYQSLLSTMAPLGVPFTGAGDSLRKQFLHSAAAARHYARNLIIDTTGGAELDPDQRAQLQAASRQLSVSLSQLVSAEEHHDPNRRRYVRSAALFDLLAASTDRGEFTTSLQLALRDLQLIDGAMAAIAQTAGLSVQALDTDATLPVGTG